MPLIKGISAAPLTLAFAVRGLKPPSMGLLVVWVLLASALC
jgi:hypothetical protein